MGSVRIDEWCIWASCCIDAKMDDVAAGCKRSFRYTLANPAIKSQCNLSSCSTIVVRGLTSFVSLYRPFG